MGADYETIGRSYAAARREDPRIAAAIVDALGPAASVVNVGAGTGNYEPLSRPVVAVEPSGEMIRQRTNAHPVTKAVAEALPFPPGSFDAAMAVLTVHHWSDVSAGLRELRRVAGRQVVFFFEPSEIRRFWAYEYFAEAGRLPSERAAPGEAALRAGLDVAEVRVVEVPADCTDGFGAAFWNRPEAYLDPAVQAGMSCLALLPEPVRRAATARLADDLRSGAWDRRHGHLRRLGAYDAGYRIAIAR